MAGSKTIQIRSVRARQQPVTVMDIVVCVVFILSLVSVVAVIIKCLLMTVYHVNVSESSYVNDMPKTTPLYQSKGDEPCCLPYKFQAVITPLATFDATKKKIMRVYRDWESRLQAMEQTSFDEKGIIHGAYSKTIYNYQQKTAYRIKPETKECMSWEINSGMLEPCMPENSQYLGRSYIGFHDDKREFRSFYFRRTNKNRNMEMTISVTSEGCVPVMEHIKGKIGDAIADSLVFFSNVTSLQDDSVFTAPDYCFQEPD